MVWIKYTCAHILDPGLRIPVDLHLRDKDLFEQHLICKLFIYLFTYLFIGLYVSTAFIRLIKVVKFKLLGCFSLYLCCLVKLARNTSHIRTLVTTTTFSFHRLIMGKVKILCFCSLIGNIDEHHLNPLIRLVAGAPKLQIFEKKKKLSKFYPQKLFAL